jgi:predicted ATP-dependent serine protease
MELLYKNNYDIRNASPLRLKQQVVYVTYAEAAEMIRLGVKRIGTSGAKLQMEKECRHQNIKLQSV